MTDEVDLSRSGHWGAAVAGAKALMAMSRIQKLHDERQAEVETVMEAFGEAVSTAAPDAEIQRLNARLEKAQSDAQRVAELKEKCDEKHQKAEACLEQFGVAVNNMESDDVVRRLSDQWEEARDAAEREENAQLAALAQETELAKQMDKARVRAEKAEAKMLANAKKSQSTGRRGSLGKTITPKRRDSDSSAERRSGAVTAKPSEKRRDSDSSSLEPQRRGSISGETKKAVVTGDNTSDKKTPVNNAKKTTDSTNAKSPAPAPVRRASSSQKKAGSIATFVTNSGPRPPATTKQSGTKASCAARDTVRTPSAPLSTSSTRAKNDIPFPLPR